MTRFKNILCVLGRAMTCQSALERAVLLAENNQASLTLVGVIEPVTAGIWMPEQAPLSADALQAMMVSAEEQALQALSSPYRARVEINIKVLIGTPFMQIIREVLRNGHDLVLKSPAAPDWLDRLLGSDDTQLLRKCPCPVWLIKPQAPAAFRRILAAVDLDVGYPAAELETRRGLNRQIVDMAGSLALADFSELHIAHAWVAIGESIMQGAPMHMPEEQVLAYVEQVRLQHESGLQLLLADMRRHLGADAVAYLKPVTHLLKGGARKEVPALAKRISADLVVMGTVARTGVPGFIMGNTAAAILSQLDCSVLAIKPPGFVTPVTLEKDED